MNYAFLAVFIIASAVHLYASYINNRKLRAWTKGFILSALLGWYCLSASPVQGILAAALLTSWLGDMLLIPRGIVWLTTGGISFLLSHVFFVLVHIPHIDFQTISVWALVSAPAVYLIAVILVFIGLKPHLPKSLLLLPLFIYMLINITMNCFAFYQLMSAPCAATAITFAGAILFFASDSILFFVRFKKDSVWRNHFPVMLTYILAEFLIVWGNLML